MIQNALTGEPKALAQQASDFTAEGAPPPGSVTQRVPPGADAAIPPAAVAAAAAGTGAVAAGADMARGLAPATGIALGDWLALLSAVNERLRESVSDARLQPLNGAAAPLQTSVLECVAELDQLHATLRQAL